MKCKYCGKPFEKTYPNQKYCSKHCSDSARKEKRRIYNSKYFYKNRERIYSVYIGTRTIGQHRNPDPEKEQEIVQNELKRTGLQNVLTY